MSEGGGEPNVKALGGVIAAKFASLPVSWVGRRGYRQPNSNSFDPKPNQ